MALYRYKKVENYVNDDRDSFVIDYTKQRNPNAWNSMGDSYSALQGIVNSSAVANLVIPSIFILIGAFFIYQYISPSLKAEIEQFTGQVSQGTAAPAAEDYIDKSKYISNPAGLDQLAEEAFAADILQEDTVSKNYRGTFQVSIPSIGINSLPVTANVDSTTEDVYNNVLRSTLAHFENTGLPISDVNNNIVLYGHSATPSYDPNPNDPEVAFSFLSNMKIGDEIHIDMEGERYTFKMYKSKIVEPTDLSIITGSKNQRKLTLFTCYPNGNSRQRLVIEARAV